MPTLLLLWAQALSPVSGFHTRVLESSSTVVVDTGLSQEAQPPSTASLDVGVPFSMSHRI